VRAIPPRPGRRPERRVRERALTERRPHSASADAPSWGQLPPATVPAGLWGELRTLLGGKAKRFGMGPPVVLGQRLAEGAGPVGHSPLADLAAGDRRLGEGDRETA
jgi:hypothetical protein